MISPVLIVGLMRNGCRSRLRAVDEGRRGKILSISERVRLGYSACEKKKKKGV